MALRRRRNVCACVATPLRSRCRRALAALLASAKAIAEAKAEAWQSLGLFLRASSAIDGCCCAAAASAAAVAKKVALVCGCHKTVITTNTGYATGEQHK